MINLWSLYILEWKAGLRVFSELKVMAFCFPTEEHNITGGKRGEWTGCSHATDCVDYVVYFQLFAPLT